nr:hypothetical protein Iba_chr09dCG2900 [Ipomoea batatas]
MHFSLSLRESSKTGFFEGDSISHFLNNTHTQKQSSLDTLLQNQQVPKLKYNKRGR